ncbi:hypothetical protein F5Y07DRAFT_381627 [Xylaria sp. FL0933]|nr:hypothetical protein F5Y07DRAFT_381627 [Xylaria sp. FL0933]
MAFVLSELCARPHSAECDRAWECVETVYDGWKVGTAAKEEGRLALWRPIRRLMAKARYVREMQRTDPRRPAPTGAAARGHRSSPPTSVGSLEHDLPMQQVIENAGDILQLKMTDSVISLEPPLPETPASAYDQDHLEALQRVIGTERLGLFMDVQPEWPWHDDGMENHPWFAGDHFDQTPGLW